MSDDTDRRPVNNDDLYRIYHLLEMLSIALDEDNPPPMWDILRESHEHRDALEEPIHDRNDVPVGEEFLRHEITHAMLTIEALTIHDGTIRRGEGYLPKHPCLGCGTPTTTTYCFDCQMKRHGLTDGP